MVCASIACSFTFWYDSFIKEVLLLQPSSVVHPFPPVWNADSCVLILGSFPSVRSRETGFYYGHPQNRFWPLLARLYGEAMPIGTDERRAFALRNRIALWDVIQSCAITGSSDASIRDAKPNDIAALIRQTNITHIFCNGQQAYRLFQKYCAEDCGMQAISLPSTSPANAAWTMDRLAEVWQVILA